MKSSIFYLLYFGRNFGCGRQVRDYDFEDISEQGTEHELEELIDSFQMRLKSAGNPREQIMNNMLGKLRVEDTIFLNFFHLVN